MIENQRVFIKVEVYKKVWKRTDFGNVCNNSTDKLYEKGFKKCNDYWRTVSKLIYSREVSPETQLE